MFFRRLEHTRNEFQWPIDLGQPRRQSPERVLGQDAVAADVLNDRRQRGDPLAMVPPRGIVGQALALQGRKLRQFGAKLDAAAEQLPQRDADVLR